MNPGYEQPLYLLPFDHRHSYESGMFGVHPPLTTAQHEKIADSKQLIYEGFLQALDLGVPRAEAGILVDEEFGADILDRARAAGCVTALSCEKSGSEEFEFEYGDAFAAHIARRAPTFAKVLVRYNPRGDATVNGRQLARLKALSDYCRTCGPRFMFELLIAPTDADLADVNGDKGAFDLQLRPDLMVRSITTLQDAGVEPDVWKVEGLATRAGCERVVAAARRDGRSAIGCIVLGRGADEGNVVTWLETAASVPGFIGFAVGRTTFWDAVADFESGKASRAAAVSRIAQRYAEWVAVFERARAPMPR